MKKYFYICCPHPFWLQKNNCCCSESSLMSKQTYPRNAQTGSIITVDIWVLSKHLLPNVEISSKMHGFHIIINRIVLNLCKPLCQSDSYFFIIMPGASPPSTLSLSYGKTSFLSTYDTPLPYGVCRGRFVSAWEICCLRVQDRCLCVDDELAWNIAFTFLVCQLTLVLCNLCTYGTTIFNSS